MKYRTGNEVRQLFLDYFTSKKHMIEPGASLVPVNDPTLLWINSGVAALKKYLDGREKPKSNRIANAQKCIRTNDIENVGKTSRHHTFFEMLGNWSIGDYFKEESLAMTWEFLTSDKYIGFDPERLYCTVYPDDTESYDIWVKLGMNPAHILKSYDNYWQIGEGPCGPDSEVYYDRGEKYDPEGIGEALFFEERENDRYVELWNNVFSQYDAKEGVDRKDFKELPQKNIDTGMGLERLVCMVQDGETNFDTDLFLPYIRKVEEYTSVKYEENKMAFRVIADHIRTCTFALADGAMFSNEGRGYVLRRVLRRAMRYGRNLGIEKPFLYEFVDIVCDNMKDFYPYLLEKKDFVKKLIRKEEESFIQTLANGEKLLNQELDAVQDGVLKGDVIFKLYDTYGFPKEMTIESAEERGITCDMEGFETCMAKQKELARSSRNAEESMHSQSSDLLNFWDTFTFTGYEKTKDEGTITALFRNGKKVDVVEEEGDVVFDHSCFYAESGGQIADIGKISSDLCEAEVLDVKKAPNGQFLHHVKVNSGSLSVGDVLIQQIDEDRRKRIRANHSSLHLLQSALKKVLGNHVAQAGSYVSADYARFDFTHFEKISQEDLNKIEQVVNSYISGCYDISTDVMDIEEAKKTDAIALFDEKYEEQVRVVSMGAVSKEFCGGTHASNTGELGCFKIRFEESIGSGIRRIECCTKLNAYDDFKSFETYLGQIKDELKLKNTDMIFDRVVSMKNEISSLQKEKDRLLERVMNLDAEQYVSKVVQQNDLNVLLLSCEELEYDLKAFATMLKNKLDGGLCFIINRANDRYQFVAALGEKALAKGFNASNLVKEAAAMSSGKGGGRPELAQAGGSDTGNPQEILAKISSLIA